MALVKGNARSSSALDATVLTGNLPAISGASLTGISAGITMALAVASSLSNIPVRSDVAMTGEITLRGEVQEIGGLKEKLLAALRGGIKEVIIPLDNAKDLAEIPDNVKKSLKIHPVKFVDEVFAIALKSKPVKSKVAKKATSVSSKKAKTPRKQLPH